MITLIIVSIFSILIFILIFFLPDNKNFNLIIYDDINKNHSMNSKSVPLIGSLTLFPTIFYYYKNNLLLVLITLSLFLIGYLDDKFHLKIKYRFFLSLILVIFLQYSFEQYRIEFLYFLGYHINFYPITSIVLSTIMILGFLHVINMSDGRNCLVLIYFINIFTFLLIKNESTFVIEYLLILISMTLIFIQNYFNKSFFGNSGILFVSIFVAIVLIYEFNNELISIENIFMLLYIPFFDALRVTFVRIFKGNSPFLAEKNHLHHFPLNWNKALIILITLILTNNLIQLFTNFNFFIIFLYSILSFIIILKIFQKI